ncbi:membrane-flanked domain-containing protein [Methyloglobulus morosus KoM1]|uniref:Membrane-flanked domain-containing protein n=1 Tax=Methyloglobulus morosus KoM1 TaxID=1116472 RepID=V5C092_9GAMM|nr:PH domain-containing protein [Methyloglobulus morosus]ESS71917.1 membrane-flanked domain-containing protein [Methyloglobulus morosus KoM1]
MSYVESNLMSGEKIIYKAYIHWFIFLPGIIFAALGILLIAANKQGEGGATIGLLLLIYAVILLLKAFIIKISTDLAVTSKRVIAKAGFIRRRSVELNHSKVESFIVNQSIFGRMFNYGTIIVRGTGGGRTGVQGVDSPFDFRKNAMETIDQSQQT